MGNRTNQGAGVSIEISVSADDHIKANVIKTAPRWDNQLGVLLHLQIDNGRQTDGGDDIYVHATAAELHALLTGALSQLNEIAERNNVDAVAEVTAALDGKDQA